MENEKVIAVFSELLEKQKEIARSQKEMTNVFQELKVRIEAIEGAVKNLKSDMTNVDMKPIKQALEKSITEVKFSIHSQLQKQHANNWRIFLESDAKKWAVYLLVALTFLTYLYWFSTHK